MLDRVVWLARIPSGSDFGGVGSRVTPRPFSSSAETEVPPGGRAYVADGGTTVDTTGSDRGARPQAMQVDPSKAKVGEAIHGAGQIPGRAG